MSFEIKKSEIVFNGIVFNLKVDEIEYTETGNKAIREVALHHDGAVVVPVKDDGKIVMIKQYRYPLDRFLFELPAGKLEIDENPKFCAERELTEETGFTASTIKSMGSIFTTPGFCTEELYLFLAEGLTSYLRFHQGKSYHY